MTTIKLATWNVNSIRSRITNFREWNELSKPDIVLVQEIKCQDDQFPYLELADLGFNIEILGQKSYNGVAIMSKFPIKSVKRGLPNFTDEESRYIEAIIDINGTDVKFASVYAPNGASPEATKKSENNKTARFAYKMSFYNEMIKHFKAIKNNEEIAFFGGDYNICPEFIDMYSPKKDGDITCHIDERKKYREMLNVGVYDVFREKNPDEIAFSWWDYRTKGWENGRGLFLDHIVATPLAMDKVISSAVEAEETRGKDKPSDHAPVVCEIEI